MGTWMHQTAQGWLVYDLTGSAFWLGMIAFVAMSPSLVLSLYGGIIADRANRRRLLIGTQIVMMTTALVLATLTGAGVVSLGHILALSLIAGMALAITTPVYQTVLHELVATEHLMNAISLNSVQFNLARIIGPLGAGGATAILGLASCFFLNGISFLAIIAAVATLKISVRDSTGAVSAWSELRAGLSYAWRTPMIQTSLLLAAALSFFGFPYIVLLPAFAREVLHLDFTQYAYLLVPPGVGAVLGGLALAAFGNVRRKGMLATIAAVAFSVGLIGFSLSTDVRTAGMFLFFVGICQVGAISTVNTVLQLTADSRLRGRVMSMLALALFGLAPVGSLHVGAWAQYVGTARALAGGGAVCLCVALAVLALAPHFRRTLRTVVSEAG
jgi:MFS family permease